MIDALNGELDRLDGSASGLCAREATEEDELPSTAYAIAFDDWAAIWLTRDQTAEAIRRLSALDEAGESNENIWTALGGTML